MSEKKFITGKIIRITKNFFEIETKEKKLGLIYVNDISDFYIRNLSSIFQLGEEVEVLIKYLKDDIYFCDFKHGRADYLNFPFEYKIEKTENGFKNLYNYNKKEVAKWKK
ncbi:MAG: S1 domain-containing protein [Mycoplasmataceae bacterium]|nr:S1 domain-containing protein [Mycoplasmataceae bacterium]